MTTEADITQASIYVADAIGIPVTRVAITYRKDSEGSCDWTVTISYPRASSRKGYSSSVDGYAETPAEAAKEAVAAYGRAVEGGFVATERG